MGSSKILIYFHGNAEDVGLSMELLIFVRDMLKVSISSFLTTTRFMFLRWSIQAMGFTMEIQMQIKSQLMLRMFMITWSKLKALKRTRSSCLAVQLAQVLLR